MARVNSKRAADYAATGKSDSLSCADRDMCLTCELQGRLIEIVLPAISRAASAAQPEKENEHGI
jgi:hypothetical protein